jgi:hypothetical protein
MSEGAGMSRTVADCIQVAARFLAGEPGAVRRALRTHRQRRDGCCTACPPGTHWPCVVAAIARCAEEIDAPS